jgi:hypothetical protein
MTRIRDSWEETALLIERLRDGLGEDWIVLERPLIEADGRTTPVDAIVLHERHGAAVITTLGAAQEHAPQAAGRALRRMLDETGRARSLGGYLPVVALAIDPERARDPAAALRRAFLAEPPIGAKAGWMRQVARVFETEELPHIRTREALELHADREDAWRVVREARAAPPCGARITPDEHVVPAETVREGGAPFWGGIALAVVIVSAVLGGMAWLSYGNGPASAPVSAQVR